MSFQTEFKSIYEDFLSEYGYKYCSKLGYFIKVLNKELVFFIGQRGIPALYKGDKAFTIVSGITSMYYVSLEKKDLILNEVDLFRYSRNANHLRFIYTEETMKDTLTNSIQCIKEIVIPIFERINSLDSYIEYKINFGINELRYCEKFFHDSLVLIKADNHDDFMDYFQSELKISEEKRAKGIGGIGKTKEEAYSLLYNGIIESIPNSRDKVYSNTDLLQQALEEAKRRKENNLKLLESYRIIS